MRWAKVLTAMVFTLATGSAWAADAPVAALPGSNPGSPRGSNEVASASSDLMNRTLMGVTLAATTAPVLATDDPVTRPPGSNAGTPDGSQVTLPVNDPITPTSWLRSRQQVAPLCWPPVAPWNPTYPPGTVPPADPNVPAVPPGDPATNLNQLTTPLVTPTPGGGLQGRTLNESFDGDLGGVFYSRTAVVGYTLQQVVIGETTKTVNVYNSSGVIIGCKTITVPITANMEVPVTRTVHEPLAGPYSGVLVTDNDSPRPTDRVYFGYNNYAGFGASLNPGLGNVNLNREMIGFEKTFLSGNASIGARLPFVQLSGPVGVAAQSVGDLTVLLKYAFVNDPITGNVVSAGFAVTAPTSNPGGTLSDGTVLPHSVLLQPWVGFIRMFDRAYVQGISDMLVPTSSRDTYLLTNSLAAGYWLYQNLDGRGLRGIIPTVEVHVHTPFNNRNPAGLEYFPDEVNLTTGLHFRFSRAILSAALSTPLVGPRPWNIETIVNMNFYF